MSLLRDDARRAGNRRRVPSSLSPARVLGSGLVTALIVACCLVAVIALEMPMSLVVPAVAVAALGAAVAAHRTTANLAAGLVLVLVRPYGPGERVRIYVAEQASTVEAEVVRVGLVKTALCTSTGLLVVSNTRMLRIAPELS